MFVVSKYIFKVRYRRVDINNELTIKDNLAFSILTASYFVGILIIFCGVVQGESYGYFSDAVLIICYGILGNVFLVISSLINEKVVFASKFNLYK